MREEKFSLETLTLANDSYRKVIYTGKFQLVLMALRPGEEIGTERHLVDQFFRIESGIADFQIGDGIIQSKKVTVRGMQHVVAGESYHLVGARAGDAIIVPAMTYHNVINPSRDRWLRLYTLYSSPTHPPKTIEQVKGD